MENELVRAFDRELAALEAELTGMGDGVLALLQALAATIAEPASEALDRIVAGDDEVDAAYTRIEQQVVELIARRQPVAGDLRRILATLQAGLHLERIADGAVEAARLLQSGAAPVGDGAAARWRTMVEQVAELTRVALGALADRDAAAAESVAVTDRSLDALHDQAFEAVLAGADGSDLRTCILADRVARTLERAGDHAVDIAEDAYFVVTGEWREFRDGSPAR